MENKDLSATRQVQEHPHVRYLRDQYDAETMKMRAAQHFAWMDTRRTCRDFSDRPIPKEVIEHLLLAASTAPSGAHKQPWTFCVVSNPDIKKAIRIAAEEEEFESYHGRMSEEWLNDLKPIGTNWKKPFLETAPYLIVVFRRIFEYDAAGGKHQNYYVQESCGIATGFLLAAIHHAGLIALTHTPSPMNFLSHILLRPDNEKPYLLIPVGYPADECWVPDLKRKTLEQCSVWFD
jgi:iodotyrosine deiodinase